MNKKCNGHHPSTASIASPHGVCRGDVREVVLMNKDSKKSWVYWSCQEAIIVDRSHGFKVEEVKNG